ncbi:MAG: NOP5/NOP56 family protein [Methanobacteriota archaeon]
MLLVTTWFGTFLLDEGKVVRSHLFPKEPAALADRMAVVEDWKVLDEERALMGSVDETFVIEPRLERAGGNLTSERPPFLAPEDFGFERGLLHAAMVDLAKRRMRKAIRPEDHLRQAVAALADVQDQENLALERLREWYGLHFPELARIVDDRVYRTLIATHGRRDSMPVELTESVGAELGEAEEREVRGLAELGIAIASRREALEAYVERSVRTIAPNVADLTGPVIAAKLVSQAGGIEELARLPAGTIQLLGAERALFLHLRTGAKPPKHGLLFQHPLVHRARPWQRGAIARAFAAKIAIAARADAYTKRRISEQLQADLRRTVEGIAKKKETKPAHRTKERPRPRRPGRRR